MGEIFLTPSRAENITAEDFTPALMAGIGFRLVLLDSIDLTFNFGVSQIYSKSGARLTFDGGYIRGADYRMIDSLQFFRKGNIHDFTSSVRDLQVKPSLPFLLLKHRP